MSWEQGVRAQGKGLKEGHEEQHCDSAMEKGRPGQGALETSPGEAWHISQGNTEQVKELSAGEGHPGALGWPWSPQAPAPPGT